MLKDKDIREPLFEYLEEIYGKIRILEEKNVGNSRADIMMVLDGAIVGIEIKSDADTYARLKTQVKDYDKYFDYNIVAVGSTHGHHIAEHVPKHWGIITIEVVDGEFDFYYLRKPSLNMNMEWRKKLGILWRPEIALIQEKYGMPKYKQKRKEFVIGKICEKLLDEHEEELNFCLSEILFERDYNEAEKIIEEYRKGEIQKKLEKEDDPKRQIELMMERAAKRVNLKNITRRKRKRR